MKLRSDRTGLAGKISVHKSTRPLSGFCEDKNVKAIGVTGGVGSGKSEVLGLLKEICNCKVIMADDIANILKLPGQPCYQPVVDLLGEEILSNGGHIDNRKMAALIFPDQVLLKQVNDIIHPAVKDYILREIKAERDRDEVDFFFVEAALLIECGYRSILDELWYVYADEETRIARLKDSRGYTQEKARGIIASQLSEDEYRSNCDWVLNNSGSIAQTQILLKEHITCLREN